MRGEFLIVAKLRYKRKNLYNIIMNAETFSNKYYSYYITIILQMERTLQV